MVQCFPHASLRSPKMHSNKTNNWLSSEFLHLFRAHVSSQKKSYSGKIIQHLYPAHLQKLLKYSYTKPITNSEPITHTHTHTHTQILQHLFVNQCQFSFRVSTLLRYSRPLFSSQMQSFKQGSTLLKLIIQLINANV